MKKLLSLLLCMLLLLPICGCDALEGILNEWEDSQKSLQVDSDFSVHFIDVGQGDCILIRSGEHSMLIDAGENSAEAAVADYIDSQQVDAFDYVVATHAHSDHIGSLDYVVAHFDVGQLLVSPQESDTNVYKKLMEAAEKTDTPVKSVMAGDRFTLGEAQVFVLGPQKKSYKDINNSSVVLRVVFGKTSFLFTGDAEDLSEKEMLESGMTLSADVLKAGHHGSSSSSGYTFLREVMPEYVVIQVGQGNDYGHPHEETMSRFRDEGATVYRNDMHGSVEITSDGTQLQVITEKEEAPIYSTRNFGDSSGYIGNKNSQKFHCPDCSGLPSPENRVYFATREEAIAQGYDPCGTCKP